MKYRVGICHQLKITFSTRGEDIGGLSAVWIDDSLSAKILRRLREDGLHMPLFASVVFLFT